MTTWLKWALSALRVALGLSPSDPLTPAHGWLLPARAARVAVMAPRR
jgi:hypothetical protein